jgi:hypothetical protein
MTMSEKSKVLDQLKTQKEALAAEEPDPKQTLREWKTDLKRLFKDFRSWMKEAEQEGLLEIQDQEVHLEETKLGKYVAPALRVQTPRVGIRIIPRARYVTGARGRVDLETSTQRLMLLRTDKHAWKFAHWGGRQYETTDLTEDSFWKEIGSLLQ